MKWGQEVTAPTQWLVNLMAVIPKKKGHRTVATMASGCRVYTGLDDEGEWEWIVETPHGDDSSKPDTSCLRATEEKAH